MSSQQAVNTPTQVMAVTRADDKVRMSWVCLWGLILSHQGEQLEFLTDTVLAVWSKFVTLVAQTLEGADLVEAPPVSAHLAKKRAALVYVCKQRGVSASGGVACWHIDKRSTLRSSNRKENGTCFQDGIPNRNPEGLLGFQGLSFRHL